MGPAVSLSYLSSILWHERRLARLAGENATARFALQAVELERAVVVGELAEALQLGADVTLHQLAEEVPAPWSTVLERHRVALLQTADGGAPRSLSEFLR
jgi:hypothetical protein